MTTTTGRRLGALAATATALTLAAPAVASAAVSADIAADNAVVLSGDGAGDQLTLADNGAGRLTWAVNGGAPIDDFDLDAPDVQPIEIAQIANRPLRIALGDGNDALSFSGGALAAFAENRVSVDGGAGDDAINGTNRGDLLRGGPGVDVFNAGGGDDTVIGDTQNDRMSGGAGDDVLVWNNGDGTDDTFGDDGYDVTEVNGAAANETYTVKPQDGFARLDRTLVNGAPQGAFGMNMRTEAVELNALGGGDDLTIQNGTPIVHRVDGGSGNDTLRGANGDDSLFGGGGNDTLAGGGGLDALDGSVGDDSIDARDGGADLVRCAAGTDSAVLDALGVDAQSGCERLDQPSGGPGAGRVGRLVVSTKRAKARLVRGRYRMSVRVRCPSGGARCNGRLRLTARRPSSSGAQILATLTTKRYRVSAGRGSTLRLAFSRRTRAFARRGAISTLAVTQADSVGGVTAIRSSTLRIALPRKR